MQQASPGIRSLRARLTRSEAVAALQRSPWSRLGSGPLRSVAAVYVPFRVYRVETRDRGRQRSSLLAGDGVTGTLDPYAFEQLPSASELIVVESANVLPSCLDDATGARLLEDKVRRIVYQCGFFRLRRPEVRTLRLPLDVHVPYWLGVFGTGTRVRLGVLDAARGRPEGARARALFEDWLLGRLPEGISIGA